MAATIFIASVIGTSIVISPVIVEFPFTTATKISAPVVPPGGVPVSLSPLPFSMSMIPLSVSLSVSITTIPVSVAMAVLSFSITMTVLAMPAPTVPVVSV